MNDKKSDKYPNQDTNNWKLIVGTPHRPSKTLFRPPFPFKVNDTSLAVTDNHVSEVAANISMLTTYLARVVQHQVICVSNSLVEIVGLRGAFVQRGRVEVQVFLLGDAFVQGSRVKMNVLLLRRTLIEGS